MPIKFIDLFQDSWNFVRNRPHFALYAVGLLTALQTGISLSMPKIALNEAQIQQSPEQVGQLLASQLTPMILSTLALMFVNVLLVLNVKAINNGTYQTFFQHIPQALQRFLIAAVLTFIQMLPISFGATFFLMGGELLALPLLLTGLYVFVKLNLVVYAYLLEERGGIMPTLKFTWSLSRGRMLPLILFSALIYIVPSLLGIVASGLNAALGGVAGTIAAQAFNAVINLFLVIFSFRFYQVYRSQQGA